MVFLDALTKPCSNVKVPDGSDLVRSCEGITLMKGSFEEWKEGYGYAYPDAEQLEDDEPLLSLKSFIRHLGSVGTVDAEAMPRRHLGESSESMGFGEDCRIDAAGQREFETHALPPCTLEVTLPRDHVPGERVRVKGPRSFISLVPPEAAGPSPKQKVRLAPKPEFQIEVPPGTAAGAELKFDRDDGTSLAVTVPKGLRAGETFEVLPPALMVHMPRLASPGDFVVFSGGVAGAALAGVPPSAAANPWRARIPKGVLPEEYFAVRIPASEHNTNTTGTVTSM
jgi:hypothetical protein